MSDTRLKSTSYSCSITENAGGNEKQYRTLLHVNNFQSENPLIFQAQKQNHHSHHHTKKNYGHRNNRQKQQQLNERQHKRDFGKRIQHAGNECLVASPSTLLPKSLLLAFLLAFIACIGVCAANETHQHQTFSVENNIDPETAALLDHHSTLIAPPEALNQFHVIEDSELDCVKITLDEGIFHYKSRAGSRTCGLYLISDPDKVISITVEYLDVRCHDGLISVVDGWEMNGEVFPSYEDHEKSPSNRFHDICVNAKQGLPVRRVFTSSQNAALIQYRIPVFGQGFSVRVEHIPNPRPCNILVQDIEGIFTLENHGRNVNCSLMTIFDSKIRIMYMSTGVHHRSSVKSFAHSPGLQKGIYHKCAKLGMEDYVEIGGSGSLDTSKAELVEEICGYQPRPSSKTLTIFCGMTTIRLVSSGKYANKIVAEVVRADMDLDLDSANYICDLGFGYK